MNSRSIISIAVFVLQLSTSIVTGQSTAFHKPVTSSATPGAHSASMSDAGWTDLINLCGPVGIRECAKGAILCGDVKLSKDSGELVASRGSGVVAVVSKKDSRCASDLISTSSFGDCEIHLEFMICPNSNSGVKLQQRYEIQIFDSYGLERPAATDCGGIYPHWVYPSVGPGIEYIDEGVPPSVNAAKAAGEWQTLLAVFRAPRFDSDGKKTRNARFDRVVLNGILVHRNIELDSPTGNTSTPLAEVPEAPILLQLDHGPVAFRNVRVRPL